MALRAPPRAPFVKRLDRSTAPCISPLPLTDVGGVGGRAGGRTVGCGRRSRRSGTPTRRRSTFKDSPPRAVREKDTFKDNERSGNLRRRNCPRGALPGPLRRRQRQEAGAPSRGSGERVAGPRAWAGGRRSACTTSSSPRRRTATCADGPGAPAPAAGVAGPSRVQRWHGSSYTRRAPASRAAAASTGATRSWPRARRAGGGFSARRAGVGWRWGVGRAGGPRRVLQTWSRPS